MNSASKSVGLYRYIMINVSCCASINALHVQLLFDDKRPGTGCTKGGSDIQQIAIFSTTGKKAMTPVPPGVLNSHAMKVTSTRKC